ncbi:MAG: hypothetical protein WC747_00630 [Candidatus Babeliales bacterium]|jgi:enolase
MIIIRIFAEEIFNAQGLPTIQCSIELENAQTVKSSIPSGFDQPLGAATYVYDTNNRIVQERMHQSINFINDVIAPAFINQPINALAMDSMLMDLDSALVGSNTTLVVSMSLFKAQAAAEGLHLFQFLQTISGTEKIFIPKPLTSIFQCRTDQSIPEIKEVLVIPHQSSYENNLHAAILLHHHTKKILQVKHHATTTGPYGSFSPHFTNIDEIFTLLESITQTIPDHTYEFGLHIAAQDFYDDGTKIYSWNKEALSSQALVDTYSALINKHPSITYLQDPMAETDHAGWKLLTRELSPTMKIAGDKIFSSNPMKIRWGILQRISNMVIIKPEYLGTISRTIAAIDACRNNNRVHIIAGDSMGTNDSFVSDLAVGTGAAFLKAGAPYGSEHMTKYNRLLEIERYLMTQKCILLH